MKEVKIYTIVSDQLSPPITGESFCTDMVRYSDYAELEAKYAALAEVRESVRNEGINYAASRLAAAFNHGFLDKPVSEVLDVTRMILSAKEDLANDPLPADDGLSGEYAEKAIEEWADQIRKGVQS
ncbi:Eae protein [Salmonella enterica]|uniref:Eae protein n=1 Tax=Salmonella enterica TaxID=28901 RepID=UPI0008FC9857|nr:Eae protein [Salmonella enterica]EBG0355721.1 Eae protein [Salmonella enterica subsp. enterica serovar Ruiru]EBW8251773.1 Eae protein [Salmonella enterica subsp. enterica serovar Typhimurium]EDA3396901.1 Eae protein [Salmonella enterica subsp. enterica serovar Kedougou]EDR0348573.1 Eae protein [Salmonella enterica subsp. enterica serovar Kedougou]EDR5998598.1 Eae protein [Salmonella enterica subsp. enterica serovar Kedougou]